MALSIFDNKAVMPNEIEVAAALGQCFACYQSIMKHMADAYAPVVTEWKFYGKDSGWTQNIKKGKRTIFIFVPMKGCFQACFTLSEKAAEAVKVSDLPIDVKQSVPDAKACVCGFGLRLNVYTEKEVESLKKLIEIKDKN